MSVCMYRVHEHQEREAAHLAYVSAPDFSELVAEAAKRGFRKAMLTEVHGSADSSGWAPELFSWRGGLWVKVAATGSAQ